jgi:hypothetical protein
MTGHRGRGLALAIALTTGGPLLACSGDDDGGGGGEPDGAALVDPFGEAAEAIYDDAGLDRDEGFNQGTLTETCPVLTDDDAVAIAEAVGVDDADSATVDGDNTYLSGPPQRELMSCLVRLNDDDVVGVSLGTTPVDRDGQLDELRQNLGDEIETIDGEAPGLDPDHVVAFARSGEAPVAIWIEGGFQIGLNIPDGVATPDDALNALPAAVDAVAAALG